MVASPQAENGHIDIANEIAEEFFKLQLSGNQWRILWVIFRQTYGWHKKKENISLGYISRKTRLERQHVARELKRLVERNIVTKNGNTYIATYGFQKNYERWELLPKLAPVTKIGNESVTKIGTHTYKRKIKETNTERDSRVKVFIDWWCSMYERRFKKKYAVAGAKMGKQVKNLLAMGLSWIELQSAAMLYMLDDEDFISKAGHDIGMFQAKINKYDYANMSSQEDLRKWLIDEQGQPIS